MLIPKIAWLHWEGEISWLRQRSLDTLHEHNPDWDIRVVGTPEDMRDDTLTLPQVGDRVIWNCLLEHGGFRLDSDILHLRPIPDEWRHADLAAQLGGKGDIQQMAVVGAMPGNPLMQRMVDYCNTHSPRNLQSYGVNGLRRITQRNIWQFGNVHRISHEAFCWFDWMRGPGMIWSVIGPPIDPPDDVVGIHWYGGSDASILNERTSSPDGPSWIERIASGRQ